MPASTKRKRNTLVIEVKVKMLGRQTNRLQLRIKHPVMKSKQIAKTDRQIDHSNIK
jgi:hypothetical protein